MAVAAAWPDSLFGLAIYPFWLLPETAAEPGEPIRDLPSKELTVGDPVAHWMLLTRGARRANFARILGALLLTEASHREENGYQAHIETNQRIA